MNSKYLSIADILYLNEFQYIAKGISDMSKISNFDDWLVSIKRNIVSIAPLHTTYQYIHIIPKHMHHYIARLCIWLVEWRHVTMLGHILGWTQFSSINLFFTPYIFRDTFRKHEYHYTEVHFASFRWICYYGSDKFTGKETVKTHLFALQHNCWAVHKW